jgi:hypothetical protein
MQEKGVKPGIRPSPEFWEKINIYRRRKSAEYS